MPSSRSPKKYSLKTLASARGRRLDQVLAEWLPEASGQPLSKAKVRKLIVAGAVYLNGKRIRIASKELLPNAILDVYLDLEKLVSDTGPSRDRPFHMTAASILYEDEDLIAVNKPPGLATQPTVDEARQNLFALVKRFLAERGGGAAAPYLGLHHRLDRDTSGVILFTKTRGVNAAVAALFSEHRASKVYQAIVGLGRGAPLPQAGEAWSVKNYLGRDRQAGKRARTTAVRSGGDFAHTDFTMIACHPPYAWVEARPRTGRTHQIRVHLSEGGTPIVGDATYGGEREVAPRLMLHAASLTFPHPIHQTVLTVQSPLPEDFTQCLRKLHLEKPRPAS